MATDARDVLVTGGTGYIGQRLVGHLASRGHRVRVLGPGHWWPVMLIPVYAIARLIPKTRDGATRLGLVTVTDMVWTLVGAVEHPPTSGAQILGVPDIKAWGEGRF